MATARPLLPAASFLQTDIWATFREGLGWRAHRLGQTLVLERPLPFGLTFLYSPEVVGPPDLLLTLLPEIFALAARRKSFVYRLELLVEATSPAAEEWLAAFTYTGFDKAFETVQPEDRQLIPLAHREETVLAAMKPKGRYNIRLAERSGVVVREATPRTLKEDVSAFYTLLVETARREKFAIRAESYFQAVGELLYHHDLGRLFIASCDDTPLAGALVSLYDGTASYLYGASSQLQRPKMAPYALHWAIIEWAITKGGRVYDLLAIRPPGKKRHRWDGLTRFKEQFGGEAVHLLGSWDLPLRPVWYKLFSGLERIRRKR